MDFMLGQLFLLPTSFAPAGTLLCNGQTIAIQQYSTLFQMIGTTFGGDGQTTFALPDIPPVATTQNVPISWYICFDGPWFEQGNWALLGQVMPMVVAPPSASPIAQQWLPCDGRLLSISGYAALFALLGTQFGGDGSTTFGVPNLPPIASSSSLPSGGARLPYYICIDGLWPVTDGCNAVSPSPGGGDTFMDAFLSQIYQVPYLPATVDHLCNFALCAGQMLSVEQNNGWAALYSLVGTQFGSNGQPASFALPNIPTGANHIAYMMTTNGVFPPRD